MPPEAATLGGTGKAFALPVARISTAVRAKSHWQALELASATQVQHPREGAPAVFLRTSRNFGSASRCSLFEVLQSLLLHQMTHNPQRSCRADSKNRAIS